jgi:hypothetical protein
MVTWLSLGWPSAIVCRAAAASGTMLTTQCIILESTVQHGKNQMSARHITVNKYLMSFFSTVNTLQVWSKTGFKKKGMTKRRIKQLPLCKPIW